MSNNERPAQRILLVAQPDAMAAAGAGLIVVGVALWSFPLALIVCGSFLVATACAVFEHRRKGGQR